MTRLNLHQRTRARGVPASRRLLAVSSIIIILVAGIVPTVFAAHDFAFPGGAGTTTPLEDDNAVVDAPGHLMHGRANRVVPSGARVGDGSLYLDARMEESLAVPGAESSIPVSRTSWDLINRPDILTPGVHRPWAWFGWWNDLNNDGAIADLHDIGCTSGCESDEFRWRGVVSGAALTITITYIPTFIESGKAGPTNSGHAWVRMEDRTRGAHQTWVGPERTSTTASLITRLTTVAYGNAREALNGGDNFPLDLGDPNALQDVDVYDVLSPDVEALYWTSNKASGDPERIARDPVSFLPLNPYPVRPPAVDGPPGPLPGPSLTFLIATAVRTATETEAGEVPEPTYPQRPPPINGVPLPPLPGPTVTSILADVVGTASRFGQLVPSDPTTATTAVTELVAVASRMAQPPYPKEPNTWEDDYGSYALFSGVGDALGSYNSYDGYLGARHLWIDTLSKSSVCFTTAVVLVKTTGSLLTADVPCLHTIHHEPVGGALIDARSAGVSLAFRMYVGLWQDLNADTHVGPYCDPTTPEFDAERNTCDIETYEAWPHGWEEPEITPACAGSSARNGRIVLTPVGGAWPRAIVIRDSNDLTRSISEHPIEVREDSEPIVLAFADECEFDDLNDLGFILSRDVLYFPEGPKVAIRVETEAVSAPYIDLETGVEVPSERVVDVDYLPAAM